MSRVAVVALVCAQVGCGARPAEPAPHERIVVEREGDAALFAVIGDYGHAGAAEGDVARLVWSWAPEFVITTGDNNYPDGGADTIDANIGQYWHGFIAPYFGSYGAGAEHNRFFPALGNHDWRSGDLAPHLDYFALPGNERYYELAWGPVRLFAVDSDSREPDGTSPDSVQGQWLHDALARAQEPWRIVYLHHPPLSSGDHGSETRMQWPFAQWGATAVLAGHDHHYERIEHDGILYFVDGLGGHERYPIGDAIEGSVISYNGDHGAMRVQATRDRLLFEFINRAGDVVDGVELGAPDTHASSMLAEQAKP